MSSTSRWRTRLLASCLAVSTLLIPGLLYVSAAITTTCDVDLGYVVDGSGSITNTVFQNQVKPFLKQFSSNFVVNGTRRSQIGSVTFSRVAELDYAFGQLQNNSQVNRSIDAMNYPASITNTPAGLDMARDQLFVPAIQSRPRIPKIALLITDGAPNLPDPIGQGARADNLTIQAANRLKQTGVILIAVGVGVDTTAERRLMAAVASDPSLFLYVNDYSRLTTIVNNLLSNICVTRCQPLPSSFSPGVVTGSGGDGCVPLQAPAIGDACRVECAAGWVSMGGTNMYQCTQNATLINATLTCTPQGCTFPSFGTGVVGTNTPTGCKGVAMVSNTSCTVMCQSGYVAAGGTTTYTCSLGRITNATLQCNPAPCFLPETLPSNSRACTAGGSLASGASCQLSCNSGFIAVGNGQYQCSFGVLSTPDDNYCVPAPCTIPPLGTNQNRGTCATSLPGDGSTCTIACDPGYVLSGSSTYTCTQGNLQRPSGTCVPKTCTVPSFPALAQSTQCSAGGALQGNGSSCKVTCPQGYDAVGPDTYVCDLGVLTQNPTRDGFKCVEAPCNVTLPANTVGAGTSPCGADMTLQSGDSCSITCAVGYSATGGGTTIQCNKGVTTAPSALLQCTLDICKYPPLSSYYLEPGTTGTPCSATGGEVVGALSCTVRCAANTVNGTSVTSEAFCTTNGLSYSVPPICVPSPCTITPPANTVGDCPDTNQLPGNAGTCKLTCADGYYQSSGSNNIFTCNAGSLDNTPDIVCTPQPCAIPAVELGYSVGNCPASLAGNGASCTLGCASGYSVSGTTRYTCNAGNLTEDPASTLVCTPNPCSVPISYRTNTVGCPATLAGTGGSCTLKCAPGYASTEDVTHYTLTCRAGQLLNPPPSTFVCQQTCATYDCSPGFYPNPAAITNGLTCADGTCDKTCCLPTKSCSSYQCPSNLAPNYVFGGEVPNCTTTEDCLTQCCRPQTVPPAKTCTLPLFEDNVVGVTKDCAPFGVLNPSESCQVQCASGYRPTATGLKTTFACDDEGNLVQKPTLTCRTTTCVVPYNVMDNVVSTECSGFNVLKSGETCTVDCAPGFKETADTSGRPVYDEYDCIQGVIRTYTITCIPVETQCRKLDAWYFGGELQLATSFCDSAARSVGDTCSATYACPTGYRSQGTTVFQCQQPDPTLIPSYVALGPAPQCIRIPVDVPCDKINPSVLLCPLGTTLNTTATCPDDEKDCADVCCYRPPPGDRVCGSFSVDALSCPAGSVVNVTAVCPGGSDCIAPCCIQQTPQPRPCSTIDKDLLGCVAGSTLNTTATCPASVNDCSDICCIPPPPQVNRPCNILYPNELKCPAGLVANPSAICPASASVCDDACCVPPTVSSCGSLDYALLGCPAGTVLNSSALCVDGSSSCDSICCVPPTDKSCGSLDPSLITCPEGKVVNASSICPGSVQDCSSVCCTQKPDRSCESLSPDEVSCPPGSIVTPVAVCPASASSCAPACCRRPSVTSSLAPCVELDAPVLSCPAGTVVNTAAQCPLSASDCNSYCCTTPPPEDRACVNLPSSEFACPFGKVVNNSAICPGSVTDCTASCCITPPPADRLCPLAMQLRASRQSCPAGTVVNMSAICPGGVSDCSLPCCIRPLPDDRPCLRLSAPALTCPTGFMANTSAICPGTVSNCNAYCCVRRPDRRCNTFRAPSFVCPSGTFLNTSATCPGSAANCVGACCAGLVPSRPRTCGTLQPPTLSCAGLSVVNRTATCPATAATCNGFCCEALSAVNRPCRTLVPLAFTCGPGRVTNTSAVCPSTAPNCRDICCATPPPIDKACNTINPPALACPSGTVVNKAAICPAPATNCRQACCARPPPQPPRQCNTFSPATLACPAGTVVNNSVICPAPATNCRGTCCLRPPVQVGRSCSSINPLTLACPAGTILNAAGTCPTSTPAADCKSVCCARPPVPVSRPCYALNPSTIACPSGTVFNSTATCPALAVCQNTCCARPSPPSVDRPCSSLSPSVLSCPSGTVVNNSAICPGSATNCQQFCCALRPSPQDRPCNTLSPSVLSCPSGTVVNNSAICPGSATNCQRFCCALRPSPQDRPCSTISPAVLSCPADTVVNNTAVCPGTATDCRRFCCATGSPVRPDRFCSTISPLELACPAGTTIDRTQICPGSAPSCTPVCCKALSCSAVACSPGYQTLPQAPQTCTLFPPSLCATQQCCGRVCYQIWGALPVKFGFFAVRVGANGFPVCFSNDGRACATFGTASQVAGLPFPGGLTVGCTAQHCKTADNWCWAAVRFCQ